MRAEQTVCGRVGASPQPPASVGACHRPAGAPSASQSACQGSACHCTGPDTCQLLETAGRTLPAGSWGNTPTGLHKASSYGGVFAWPLVLPLSPPVPTSPHHPPLSQHQPHLVTSQGAPDSLGEEETLLIIYCQCVWNDRNGSIRLRISTLRSERITCSL